MEYSPDVAVIVSGSLPPRGGWIEIVMLETKSFYLCRPSPHGEGGLKLTGHGVTEKAVYGPSPHGEGGLKFLRQPLPGSGTEVPPPTGRVD